MNHERYDRQRILPEIGSRGQQRLADAHAVLVGCGALGSHQAQLLTRAGVGWLTIIDRDLVERSNLQRQVLFSDSDAEAETPKAVAAERVLRAVNPDVRVEGVVDDLNAATADQLLADADVLCDGTDNFETRYLINDFSVRERVPWVYGGVVATGGLVMPIVPGRRPCLRCVFENPPPPGALPTCDTVGVLGSAAAVIAGIQTTETLKLLVDAEEQLLGGLVRYDAWTGEFTTVQTGSPRTECRTCGKHDFEYLEGGGVSGALRLCGRDAIQLLPGEGTPPPRLAVIAARLEREWDVTVNEYFLRARRNGITLHLFRDGRLIADGTTDETEARSLYAKVVGT